MRPQKVGAGNNVRIERILVIRRKALGDILVTLPALLQLVEAFPRARIDLIVDRPFAPLLDELAGQMRIEAWPPPHGHRTAWWRKLRAECYDLVIDYLGSPRTALWTAWTGAPLRVGFDLRWRSWAYNLHVPRNCLDGRALAAFAGEAFLDPLRALGLTTIPWQPAGMGQVDRAKLGEEYWSWVRQWRRRPSPRIGMVLSATWSAKAWPAGEASRLHELLLQEGASPLFIPGPGDEALTAALRANLPAAIFAPATNLLELADLLASLDLFVGTDSGARHLAACLGLPTITLFGPTDPLGWNPQDSSHVGLRTGEDCSPCDLTECPVPGHPCLAGLGAEMVLTAVRELWKRHRP